MLFQLQTEDADADDVLRYHASEAAAPEDVRNFASDLVKGVLANRARLEGTIAEASRNWSLEQMSKVDRVIMQIAIYEIAIARNVPVKAAINESIELAKTFSGEDAGKFVNGILGRVAAGVGTE